VVPDGASEHCSVLPVLYRPIYREILGRSREGDAGGRGARRGRGATPMGRDGTRGTAARWLIASPIRLQPYVCQPPSYRSPSPRPRPWDGAATLPRTARPRFSTPVASRYEARPSLGPQDGAASPLRASRLPRSGSEHRLRCYIRGDIAVWLSGHISALQLKSFLARNIAPDLSPMVSFPL
jgi:hypothetical protein